MPNIAPFDVERCQEVGTVEVVDRLPDQPVLPNELALGVQVSSPFPSFIFCLLMNMHRKDE